MAMPSLAQCTVQLACTADDSCCCGPSLCASCLIQYRSTAGRQPQSLYPWPQALSARFPANSKHLDAPKVRHVGDAAHPNNIRRSSRSYKSRVRMNHNAAHPFMSGQDFVRDHHSLLLLAAPAARC